MKGENVLVGIAKRIAVNEKFVVFEVFDPHFWNACLCIARHFYIAIVEKRGIRYFNEQNSVLCNYFLSGVIIQPKLK